MATQVVDEDVVYSKIKEEKGNIKQDLMLLGMLARGPKHGYDVRKEIEEKLAPLIGIKPRSIYYSLGRLEKRKLLTSYTDRSGKRPKKFVYKLTRAGHRELRHLLLANLLDIEKPCLNIDLSLFFFNHVEPDSFKKALEERLGNLEKKSPPDFKSLIKKCGRKNRDCIEKIAQRSSRMLEEEIKFTRQLIAFVEKRIEKKKTARSHG